MAGRLDHPHTAPHVRDPTARGAHRSENRRWVRTGIVELRQILYWTWDPIDVQDAFPRTANEYDATADSVMSELHRGIPASKLARWLQLAEVGFVGDTEVRSATRDQLADQIDRWYDDSRAHWLERQPRPTT